ncbi:type II toxin-antitoxin system RelE family toxin [Kyrpidia tusciae]|uniref:Plasmid stabilization system n=1 Tax=Kyrpidia tusciae (strain DSM 2912 / NBRC 15312 / T2) TaxID=562970 RepID=D5WUW8_KYRT2|nr:plasmid stabilization system [Kyrpidia tusciae]ADG07440.1 plasmid stabilization system [Kyrpidia tusciae DSM 2912]
MDRGRFDELFRQCGVQVRFTRAAAEDFQSLRKNQQRFVLALILKQAQKNPRLRPAGNRIPLNKELAGLAKIKSKSANLRVVYRPVDEGDGTVAMEIIAIGPRDHDKVYKEAARRMMAGDSEQKESGL